MTLVNVFPIQILQPGSVFGASIKYQQPTILELWLWQVMHSDALVALNQSQLPADS